MLLHPTAIIDRGAELGAGVEVGPYSIIGPDVVIGAGTVIAPHVVIHRYTTLGANCRVHAHAVIGDVPQDMAFKDTPTYTRVGDGVVMREGVTIHRGTKEGTVTVVGDGCFLMANSHVAHNCVLGRQVILANGVLLAGYVELGEKVFISGNAALHQFVRVGRLAMVGGESSLSVDLPPFCVARTGSVNTLAGLNTVGLRRAGLASAERLALRAAYHRLFLDYANRREAVAALREEQPMPVVRELLDFIATSKRGVCSPRRSGLTDAAAGAD